MSLVPFFSISNRAKFWSSITGIGKLEKLKKIIVGLLVGRWNAVLVGFRTRRIRIWHRFWAIVWFWKNFFSFLLKTPLKIFFTQVAHSHSCEKVRENLKLLVGRWKGVLWGFRTRRIRIWHFHTCKSCYSCTWDCLSHWLVHGSRLTVEVKLFGNVYVLLNPAFPMPTVQLSLTRNELALLSLGPFDSACMAWSVQLNRAKHFSRF